MPASCATILVFELGEYRYGLPLAAVCEVLPMPSIVPLPKAPSVVEGVVNIRGVVMAVMDIRLRFRLPAKTPHPTDHLLIAWAGRRRVALRVDRVVGLAPIAAHDIQEADVLSTRAEYLVGVARQPDGLVLLHDLDGFLAEAELGDLDAALGASPLAAA